METRELQGWSIRAIALAWPSFGLVIVMRLSVVGLAAMVTGIAMFALLFASVASSGWRHASVHRRRLWAALESAVWVKAAWVLVGVVILPITFSGFFGGAARWLSPVVFAAFLDEVTGALSVSAATGLTGATGDVIALHESFVETLLATLFQGAFIASGLIPLSAFVFAYQRWRETRNALRDAF